MIAWLVPGVALGGALIEACAVPWAFAAPRLLRAIVSGGFALLLATPEHGFAASSVNYGAVPQDVGTLLAGACPIVGSYGGRDRPFRGAAARLEGALDSLGIDHDVKEYPSAGHSFMNDHGRLMVLLKVMGLGYEPGAAEDAWRRILAFFGRNLHESA